MIGAPEQALADEPSDGARPGWGERIFAGILTAFELVAVTALTLSIGYWCGALRGFPKGYDALAHLSKVRLILDNWPHINWNDQWNAGMPNFTGSYPPGYHVLVAALVKGVAWLKGLGIVRIHELSATTAMLVGTGLSLVLLMLGSYGFVRLATGSRVIAWLAVLAILAEPAVWSQSLQIGLYARLLSLGLGAAALPAAVLYGRAPSRLRGAALVLFLAGSLSAHPFLGVVMTCFAAGVSVILAEGPNLRERAKPLIAPAILLCLLVSYFYVPLLLLPQGQNASLLTNTVPFAIPWRSFLSPHGGRLVSLVSWSPITLPLIAAAVVVAFVVRRRPLARVEPRQLRQDPNKVSVELDRYLVELQRTSERRRRYRPLLVLALWSWLFAAAFVAYCVLQHFTATFPYYVNGLFPDTIFAYPAFFAVLGSALALAPVARRGAVPLLLIGAAGASLLGLYLPGRALNYNDANRRLEERMVAAHIPSQHVYRIADVGDLSYSINAYTQTPQTANPQAVLALNPNFQYWLLEAILGPGQDQSARKFLFDWYAVKWILVHAPTVYQQDRSYYRLVEDKTSGVLPTTLWEIRKPTPIFTATSTRPVLVIGDALRYDLLMHDLGTANVNSGKLIPVAATSLAGFTPDELSGYGAVFLWGTPVTGSGATLLEDYVRAGGRVFLDEGEGTSLLPASIDPAGLIKKKTISHGWQFADAAPGFLPRSLLKPLPPPDYAGSGLWQITYPQRLPAGTTPLVTSHGRVVFAAEHLGKGTIVWSGINLPYLASSSLKPAATRLLVYLTTGTTDPHVTSVKGAVAQRVDAEHWKFTVPAGTKAVLLRENTSSDWHATDTTTGAGLPIRSAGPGMTLIPVPPSQSETTIELEYRFSTPEQAGVWLSGLGVLALLLYTVGVRWPARLRARLGSILLGQSRNGKGTPAA